MNWTVLKEKYPGMTWKQCSPDSLTMLITIIPNLPVRITSLSGEFAISQGFSFGSGMGTNHHYGYQVRKIYTTAWLMRDAIWKTPNRDNILSTLIFWSALQETRRPYQYGRDELLDSWHTLFNG